MILNWGIFWLEYSARCVLGAVYPCCPLTSLVVQVSLSFVFGVGLCILRLVSMIYIVWDICLESEWLLGAAVVLFCVCLRWCVAAWCVFAVLYVWYRVSCSIFVAVYFYVHSICICFMDCVVLLVEQMCFSRLYVSFFVGWSSGVCIVRFLLQYIWCDVILWCLRIDIIWF